MINFTNTWQNPYLLSVLFFGEKFAVLLYNLLHGMLTSIEW